jgi:hypothetical protein
MNLKSQNLLIIMTGGSMTFDCLFCSLIRVQLVKATTFILKRRDDKTLAVFIGHFCTSLVSLCIVSNRYIQREHKNNKRFTPRVDDRRGRVRWVFVITRFRHASSHRCTHSLTFYLYFLSLILIFITS